MSHDRQGHDNECEQAVKDRIVLEAYRKVCEWHGGVLLDGAETCSPLCSAVAKWDKCQERL